MPSLTRHPNDPMKTLERLAFPLAAALTLALASGSAWAQSCGGSAGPPPAGGAADTSLAWGRRAGGGAEPAGDEAPELMQPGDAHPPRHVETSTPPLSSAPVVSFWGGLSFPTGEAQKPNPSFVTRDVSVANLE